MSETHAAEPDRLRFIAGALSFIAPGVGQLLRRRWVEAGLFLAATCYFRFMLAGLAGLVPPDGQSRRIAGLVGGAFAVPGGLAQPTFVVFTVLTFILAGLAAWDAGRRK